PLFSEVPGLPKRVWLKRLNASARKSIFVLSVTRNVLHNAASMFQVDGPRMVFLPALPKAPAAWRVHAAVLHHCLIVGSATCQSLPTFGLSDPNPVSDTSVPSVIVSQLPLVNV